MNKDEQRFKAINVFEYLFIKISLFISVYHGEFELMKCSLIKISITASLSGAVFVSVSAVIARGVFNDFAVIEVGCGTYK